MERLGPPYGDCIKGSDPQPKRNVYEEQLPVHYSALGAETFLYAICSPKDTFFQIFKRK